MKKKAFTLTELLVVVVIIGALSAVVLPKFNKVIESRRTAEAESVMRAVRNEQEMRCTLDKNYTTNKDNLAVWPKRDSANYTYALNKNGMSATRKDKDYTLEIKTYLDGGICCSGPYCSSLNKDYPLCEDYEATPNTQDCVPAGVEEEGEVAPSRVPEPEPEPICEPTRNGKMSYTEACPDLQVGSLTLTQVGSVQYTWDENLCDYVEVGNNCVCRPSHNGQSSYTEDCTSPQIGSYTYTWDTNSCSYTKRGSCSYCQPTHNGQNSYTEDCPSPQVGSITYRWDVNTCEYEVEEHCSACQPTHNGQSSYTEDCPEGQTGAITYTWNTNTCKYNKSGSCQDSCTTSRTETSYSNVDTCDGDDTNKFSCNLYAGTTKLECIDVYTSGGSTSSSSSSCSGDSYGGGGHECMNDSDCVGKGGHYDYPWKCVCVNNKKTCQANTGNGITDSNGRTLLNPIDDSYQQVDPNSFRIYYDKVVCCPQYRQAIPGAGVAHDIIEGSSALSR